MITLYRGHSKHILGNIRNSNKKEKESEHILLTFLLVILFFIGFISISLLCFYILSLIYYTFSDAQSIGDIAFFPKWIFFFCFLTLIGKTSLFKRWVEK